MSITKKFFVGAFVLAFALVGVKSANAAYVHTVTLKQGSTGSQVMELQKAINMTSCAITSGAGSMGYETSTFGPKTKAAVVCFQNANGLTGDGVVGPMTGAKLAMVVGGSTGGTACPAGYNCTPSTPAVCPAGYTCTPSNGGTSNGSLSGGAGTLDLSSTSTDVESTVKEGDTENVLGFKAEADGSDIGVTHVKVSFANQGTSSSERLERYITGVSVMLGDTEVGSADAEDFSRDSGTPDTYSKTIALSNAVVREGDKDTFHIAVDADSNIDSDDITGADWVVQLDSVRYTDATGVILTVTGDDDSDVTDDSSYDETFDFDDSSADDDISIKSSSANPVASTLQVDADTNSDEFLVGAFKIDVDSDSSDMQINDLPVLLTFNDSDDTTGTTADGIVDSVTLSIDGEEFDADLDVDSVTDGDGTASYVAEFDDGDLVIDAGDDVEVKVYVTFKDQDGNYGAGSSVFAKVTGSDIDAENADGDDTSVTGSFTGKTHTLTVDAPVFSLVSKSFNLYQSIDGVATGEEDIFEAKFVFDVTASEDEDVYLSKGIEGDSDYSGTLNYTTIGGGTVDSVVIDAEDDSLDDGLSSSFLVTAGSTERFTVSFFVRGNNASEKVTIDSFAYGDDDDASTTYTYGSSVSSGLNDFASTTKYLAK